jgi:hypothetical protein
MRQPQVDLAEQGLIRRVRDGNNAKADLTSASGSGSATSWEQCERIFDHISETHPTRAQEAVPCCHTCAIVEIQLQ